MDLLQAQGRDAYHFSIYLTAVSGKWSWWGTSSRVEKANELWGHSFGIKLIDESVNCGQALTRKWDGLEGLGSFKTYWIVDWSKCIFFFPPRTSALTNPLATEGSGGSWVGRTVMCGFLLYIIMKHTDFPELKYVLLDLFLATSHLRVRSPWSYINSYQLQRVLANTCFLQDTWN